MPGRTVDNTTLKGMPTAFTVPQGTWLFSLQPPRMGGDYPTPIDVRFGLTDRLELATTLGLAWNPRVEPVYPVSMVALLKGKYRLIDLEILDLAVEAEGGHDQSVGATASGFAWAARLPVAVTSPLTGTSFHFVPGWIHFDGAYSPESADGLIGVEQDFAWGIRLYAADNLMRYISRVRQSDPVRYHHRLDLGLRVPVGRQAVLDLVFFQAEGWDSPSVGRWTLPSMSVFVHF